jgi:high potential iron-sulfur protein
MQRRDFMIWLGAATAWPAILLRTSPAAGADKMTRRQAEYQDTPKDIYSCATCTLFEPPKSCKVVEGEVSRDGWCKAFALAD